MLWINLMCRDTEVVPGQTSSRVTPAEKDGRRNEGQKASGTRRDYDLVTFILIMHTSGYFSEVEQYVRGIDGVESVKGDSNSNKLEVKGKVCPSNIRKMVESKTKTEVKLIFPSPGIEGYGDQNECPEEKLEEKTRPDDIANKKSEESVTVLKITLCCEYCNKKLRKILKVKRLEMVAMDNGKDLVTVKGTVNMTELRSYIKRVLKKDIEVVVPVNKDTVATEKKDKETGAISKKDRDVGSVDKKGKESGTAEMILRGKETEPTYKKSEGKDAGAMDTKKNKVGTTKIRDTDSEPRDSAGVENKSENKDTGVNQKKDKDKDVGHRKTEEASSDGSSHGNYREEGISVTTKLNPPYYDCRPADYRYNDSSCAHSHPENDSNWLHKFSDENPHSCTIL